MKESKFKSTDLRHLYTEDYFLHNVTGFNEFMNFTGKYDQLVDKFKLAVDLLELSEEDSFIDIGCGRGELVIYHAKKGGKSTGVDFSNEAINLAKSKASALNISCNFVLGSFESIISIQKYNKICSLDFIEHISAEEGNILFRKIYELLLPGGRVVIYTFPNKIRRKYGYKLIYYYSLIKGKPVPYIESDATSDHYKFYHLNEQSYFSLRKAAKKAGFKEIQIEYNDSSLKNSIIKKIFRNTPIRHLFMRGLTLVAYK